MVDMKYNYRLVEQESDHEDHIPNESDFFVIENWEGCDFFYRVDSLLKGSPHPFRQDDWNRCREWLKENYPEFFI